MSLTAKAMVLFMHMGHFSMFAVPLAPFALTLIRPCTPPFLLSISQKCEEISWFGPAIFVPLFELWVSFQIFLTGTLWIYFGIFVSVVTLQNYFRILDRYELYILKHFSCQFFVYFHPCLFIISGR